MATGTPASQCRLGGAAPQGKGAVAGESHPEYGGAADREGPSQHPAEKSKEGARDGCVRPPFV
eukprot:7532019-Heterocapsa_arctica.AAC.1